jgi:hypothetical protein
MRIELTTAVIAALASIAGSAVGGGAAYLANEQQQDEDSERERNRARAIAMLETNRLQTLHREIQLMARHRLYVASSGELSSDLGSQDLALVVARLTLRQSADLAGARVCADRLDTEMRGYEAGDAIPPELIPAFDDLRGCIHEGLVALRPLVGTEPVD